MDALKEYIVSNFWLSVAVGGAVIAALPQIVPVLHMLRLPYFMNLMRRGILWVGNRYRLHRPSLFKLFKKGSGPSEDIDKPRKTRFVYSWVENDTKGLMKIIAKACQEEQISKHVIAIPDSEIVSFKTDPTGRKEMGRSLKKLMDTWNADLGLVAEVSETGEEAHLWFKSRKKDDKVDFYGDSNPHKTIHGRLSGSFRTELRKHIILNLRETIRPNLEEKSAKDYIEQAEALLDGNLEQIMQANLHCRVGELHSHRGFMAMHQDIDEAMHQDIDEAMHQIDAPEDFFRAAIKNFELAFDKYTLEGNLRGEVESEFSLGHAYRDLSAAILLSPPTPEASPSPVAKTAPATETASVYLEKAIHRYRKGLKQDPITQSINLNGIHFSLGISLVMLHETKALRKLDTNAELLEQAVEAFRDEIEKFPEKLSDDQNVGQHQRLLELVHGCLGQTLSSLAVGTDNLELLQQAAKHFDESFAVQSSSPNYDHNLTMGEIDLLPGSEDELLINPSAREVKKDIFRHQLGNVLVQLGSKTSDPKYFEQANNVFGKIIEFYGVGTFEHSIPVEWILQAYLQRGKVRTGLSLFRPNKCREFLEQAFQDLRAAGKIGGIDKKVESTLNPSELEDDKREGKETIKPLDPSDSRYSIEDLRRMVDDYRQQVESSFSFSLPSFVETVYVDLENLNWVNQTYEGV